MSVLMFSSRCFYYLNNLFLFEKSMFKWISKDRPAGLLLRCIAERKLNVAIVSVYVFVLIRQ